MDFGYLGSYHNITILHKFKLHKNWHQFFLNDDDYFEYFLGNLNLGEKMFIAKKIGRRETGPNATQDVIKTYNKMYVGYKGRMEGRIGELKRKWRQLMKRFDSTKPKYIVLFKVIVI